MTYGTPTPNPDRRSYEVNLNHTSIQPAGDIRCTLVFGEVSEANTDQCVQDFVDMVAASSDFIVAYARKTLPAEQTITPSGT